MILTEGDTLRRSRIGVTIGVQARNAVPVIVAVITVVVAVSIIVAITVVLGFKFEVQLPEAR